MEYPLPVELTCMIVEHLSQPSDESSTPFTDIRNFALANKRIHSHVDAKSYTIAVDRRLPILAWAYSFPSSSEGPSNAAKAYLQAGGRLAYDAEPWRGELSEMRRQFNRVEIRHGPDRKKREDPYKIFYQGIRSEIGKVLAQILKPRGYPTDRRGARLAWIRLILQNARVDILEKVEWQLLFCWMCLHFDEHSTATCDYFNTIMDHVDGGSGAPVRIPATAVALDHHEVLEQLPEEPGHDEGNEQDVWSFYYMSQCPLKHLVLNLRTMETRHDYTTLITSRMKSFIQCLVDRGLTFVEPATMTFLIRRSDLHPMNVERTGWLALLDADKDDIERLNRELEDILKLLCQVRFASEPEQSHLRSTWLGLRVLPIACWEGHDGAARILIDMGADVNVADDEGKTALMHTSGVSASSHRVAQVLIDHGADLAVLNHNGYSNVLTSTLLRNRELLLGWDESKIGDAEDVVETYNGIIAPIKRQMVDHIKHILEHSHDDVANAPEKRGARPPLLIAMGETEHEYSLDVVELLLQGGADPNVLYPQDGPVSSRKWLLHHAARARPPRKDLVDLLLDYGARPDNQDHLGRTAGQLYYGRWYPRLCTSKGKEDKKGKAKGA